MTFDCPDGYVERIEPCPYCKGNWFYYEEVYPHMKVCCVHCNKFVEFAPKTDSKKLLANWKRSVKERDNYICQRCGEPLQGKRAEAHHKLPVWFIRNTRLKNLEFDIDNGITLCLRCHKQIHGVNGTIKEEEENAET